MKPDLREVEGALRGRKVLVTGHSGFTGGWLSLWLDRIGCPSFGISLAPVTTPNLFQSAGVDSFPGAFIDIADHERLAAAIRDFGPEVIFHLAAQPLVSQAYADPVETFRTNVSGTAHVLEAARTCPSVKAVVCVTTDKVYKDRNWHWGYRENDVLGGKDPYSASKSAAEMVIASYQATLAARGNGVRIGIARGGNIVGGGDWSDNRIVPDFVRAVVAGRPLVMRNPDATRPWQHVLALVHGYLQLAAALLGDTAEHAAQAWNFGPNNDGVRTVGELVDELGRNWRKPEIRLEPGTFLETRLLHLDSTAARVELGWSPPLSFSDTMALTAQWYAGHEADPGTARALTLGQIDHYRALAGAGT